MNYWPYLDPLIIQKLYYQDTSGWNDWKGENSLIIHLYYYQGQPPVWIISFLRIFLIFLFLGSHLFVLIDILKLLGIIKPTAVISNPIISIDNDYYKENIVPNQTQDQNPINTKFNLLIFISAILILLAIVGIYYKYTKDSKKNNKKNNSMTMINKALIFTFILGLAYYTVITVTQ